jgi:signal recognition particle GTPase
LLKKGVKFEWTQEHQNAFEDIKQKLCSYDASLKVIAAILLQISNKIKLTSTEQKWTIKELEMLALCFAP